MSYAVKAKRENDGSYTFNYGRGSKKLTARVRPDAHSPGFVIANCPEIANADTLRNLKIRWGELAAKQYENGDATEAPAIAPEPSEPGPDAALPDSHPGSTWDCVPPVALLAMMSTGMTVSRIDLHRTLNCFGYINKEGKTDTISAERVAQAYHARLGQKAGKSQEAQSDEIDINDSTCKDR